MLPAQTQYQCSSEISFLGRGLGTPAVVDTHCSVAGMLEAFLRHRRKSRAHARISLNSPRMSEIWRTGLSGADLNCRSLHFAHASRFHAPFLRREALAAKSGPSRKWWSTSMSYWTR